MIPFCFPWRSLLSIKRRNKPDGDLSEFTLCVFLIAASLLVGDSAGGHAGWTQSFGALVLRTQSLSSLTSSPRPSLSFLSYLKLRPLCEHSKSTPDLGIMINVMIWRRGDVGFSHWVFLCLRCRENSLVGDQVDFKHISYNLVQGSMTFLNLDATSKGNQLQLHSSEITYLLSLPLVIKYYY